MKIEEREAGLVRHLEILRVLPCLADPTKIRFTSRLDRDVAELFPYLNAVKNGAIYNHAGKTITLKREGRLITVYPSRIEAAKIDDLDDAHATIAWVVDLINDCARHRLEINPDFSRRDHLTVLDIVKLLPGTQCKKCGYATCLAFAAALSEDKISVLTCADLFLAPYREPREVLLALLKAGGYTLPDVLNSPDEP